MLHNIPILRRCCFECEDLLPVFFMDDVNEVFVFLKQFVGKK